MRKECQKYSSQTQNLFYEDEAKITMDTCFLPLLSGGEEGQQGEDLHQGLPAQFCMPSKANVTAWNQQTEAGGYGEKAVGAGSGK